MSSEQFMAVSTARIQFDGEFSRWAFEPTEQLTRDIQIDVQTETEVGFVVEIVMSLQINHNTAPRGLLGGRFEVIQEQAIQTHVYIGERDVENPYMRVGIPKDIKSVIVNEIEHVASSQHSLVTPCKMELKYGMFEIDYYDEIAYRLLTRSLLYIFGLKARSVRDINKYDICLQDAYNEVI